MPLSIVVNASAAKFLHAVGSAFRFNGRVVRCGRHNLSNFGLLFSLFPSC
jgi:hypothetical protein